MTKIIGHQQVFLVSQHTYLMQLLYLGKLSRPKYHEFSLKVLIFSMLQYYDINCKTVTILCYLLIIQLTVYNRTITRLIADDKVVYQQVRWEMRLVSVCLKHLIWRSRWIILCTFEQRIAVSMFMRNLYLFGLSTWLSTRSSTAMRQTQRCLPLPGCRTIVHVLWTVD